MVLRARFRRHESGLTLIEVLVAATILALALLGLAPMFTGAVRSNASANQMTNANTLAREKLEELSGYPRNNPRLAVLTGQNTATFPNDLPNWFNPKTGAFSGNAVTSSPGIGWYLYPYTRTYTVEQFDGDLTTRITAPAAYVVKLVTVTVRPTRGPFPGLRATTQSLYLRVRDAT
jgi:prepilin-type N-terminal cleavage/methylation domain-containing protein